jgi:pilus assembly protein CpaC
MTYFRPGWARLLCGAAVMALAAGHAWAQPAHAPTIRTNAPISLDADTATLINLPEAAKTVFVASPDIADIQVASPTSVLVYGKKPGTTTVFAISETGITSSYSVRVSRPVGELMAALRREVPAAQNITVNPGPGGITVSGHVGSPSDAAKLRSVAEEFVGDKEKLNFDVAVDSVTQVTLRVRIAEVSRTIDRALGVNLGALATDGSIAVGLVTGRTVTSGLSSSITNPSSTSTFGSLGGSYQSSNGKVNLTAVIDALDQEGLVTILAEPTLTATSGQTANFLAGGEFPIPIPQGNQNVTVEYKRYGVSVDFTPTVLDGNRISIKVKPEVSQLTTVGDLQLDNISVPALIVRRVDTTVELGSGESFVIAGLFQNNGQNQIQQLPGLGDLPILGPLFRSTSFQRNESELVIIVTPFLVRPVAHIEDLHTPDEGLQFSSDIELILRGRINAAHVADPSVASQPIPHLNGAAGFMLE